MTGHLLSLSAMYDEAQGSLDVIFGPDGDFEGAPSWRPYVYGHMPLEFSRQASYHRMSSLTVCAANEAPCVLVRSSSGRVVRLVNARLDTRIISVAARLNGLCAMALGAKHADGWLVYFGAEHAYLLRIGGDHFQWRLADGTGVRAWEKTNEPDLPIDAMASPAAFTAALTLALASKIAGLTPTSSPLSE